MRVPDPFGTIMSTKTVVTDCIGSSHYENIKNRFHFLQHSAINQSWRYNFLLYNELWYGWNMTRHLHNTVKIFQGTIKSACSHWGTMAWYGQQKTQPKHMHIEWDIRYFKTILYSTIILCSSRRQCRHLMIFDDERKLWRHFLKHLQWYITLFSMVFHMSFFISFAGHIFLPKQNVKLPV